MEWKMPGLSDEWIYATNRTNCHMIYQYATIASRPDKEIKTVCKKKKKKKKQTHTHTHTHRSYPIKERCTAEATVQNKSSHQQGTMFKSGLHSYRNYTWKYIITGHIPSVLLITTFCCAQALSCKNPRVSNYRSNYPISGQSASFGLLNLLKNNVHTMLHGVSWCLS